MISSQSVHPKGSPAADLAGKLPHFSRGTPGSPRLEVDLRAVFSKRDP